jgi:uncharacterized SAM-binding protein YcdF (DUF218 family)
MNDRATERREPEMYPAPQEVATSSRTETRRRVLHAAEGAIFGVAFWTMLLVLGFPWVLHLEGFDGLIPCAILGAVLGLAGLRVVTLVGLAAVCILLMVVAYTPLIGGQVRSLIRNDPLPSKADAVMVLSAGVNDDGTISSTAMDRLLKGLELVNRGVAPILVVSREAYIINGRYVSSRADQERIVSLSTGTLSKLVVAGIAHSTRDEAIRARNLVRARNWKRIVVVTSPMHTRRACAAFEKVGVVISCAASNTRAFAIDALWSPMDRVRAFEVWLYELAGTLRYRQLGWI